MYWNQNHRIAHRGIHGIHHQGYRKEEEINRFYLGPDDPDPDDPPPPDPEPDPENPEEEGKQPGGGPD